MLNSWLKWQNRLHLEKLKLLNLCLTKRIWGTRYYKRQYQITISRRNEYREPNLQKYHEPIFSFHLSHPSLLFSFPFCLLSTPHLFLIANVVIVVPSSFDHKPTMGETLNEKQWKPHYGCRRILSCEHLSSSSSITTYRTMNCFTDLWKWWYALNMKLILSSRFLYSVWNKKVQRRMKIFFYCLIFNPIIEPGKQLPAWS